MEQQWLDVMTQEFLLSRQSTKDVYNKSSYSAGELFNGHLMFDKAQRTDEKGRTIGRSGSVICFGVVTAANGDLLTLPDGTQVRISGTTTYYDEAGEHHTTLRFE